MYGEKTETHSSRRSSYRGFFEAAWFVGVFLAKNISVSPRRINEIVRGTRAVTADTALRFGKFFGTSPHFWLALQAQYELAIQQDALGRTLQRHVKTLKTAQ